MGIRILLEILMLCMRFPCSPPPVLSTGLRGCWTPKRVCVPNDRVEVHFRSEVLALQDIPIPCGIGVWQERHGQGMKGNAKSMAVRSQQRLQCPVLCTCMAQFSHGDEKKTQISVCMLPWNVLRKSCLYAHGKLLVFIYTNDEIKGFPYLFYSVL